MNAALNHFRAGVIMERGFARAVTELFGVEQWHARCEHLAECASVPGNADPLLTAEQHGRLAVALHILEALESDRTEH